MSEEHDPFRRARETSGALLTNIEGEQLPLVLRYDDLKAAAADFQTYSSDAPFRVPVPAEHEVRSVRQLPIETDPPEHTDYRAIIQPFFNRPRTPDMVREVGALVADALAECLDQPPREMVFGFAVPLQSRALAALLRMPPASAEEWIGWGKHVFRSHDAADGTKKGPLEAYLEQQLARADAAPGEDFFSALNEATYRGRPLSREEKLGFANLVFAGGRDTVINVITLILTHFAERPEDLVRIREGDERVTRRAVEEFVRFASPLGVIGRVCPRGAEIHGVHIEPGHRVGLCWASGNRDATVFDDPDTLRMERNPNRHLGFGWGPHACLGAFHARLLLRTLIRQLGERVAGLQIHSATPAYEKWPGGRRSNGFERLVMSLQSR